MQAIVAVDAAWGIGKDGDQLCYIPADLKRFQALTTGHPVLVGRKTLATFPGGRPLKNRRNLILTTDPNADIPGGEVFSTWEAALAAAPEDTFVIGGEMVYRKALPLCDRVYVTKIDKTFPADRFFPNLEESGVWRVEQEEGPFTYEGLSYSYLLYARIK